MKTFKLLTIIAGILALAALLSCTEKVEDPFIQIEGQKAFNLQKEGTSVQVKVLSNRDWKARIAGDADWIVVEPATGKASSNATDVTITVLANNKTNRDAVIEFYTGTAFDVVEITQEGPAGDATPKPSGKGTLESPYNVAAALQVASGLSWTSNDNCEKAGPYYVKGKISRIGKDKSTSADLTYAQSGNFSNATFYISDDGSTNDEFYCYRLSYLGNKKFTSGQTDIEVGDEVVIYAELMNYSNNTPENSGGYLYSLNGETSGGTTPEVPAGNPEGDGSEASPYNVAAALQATANLSWTSNDSYQKVGPYYVKGKISQIGKDKDTGADLTYTQSGTFSNATFYISDDGSTSNEFYCYRLSYLGNQTFSSGMTDIKVGDEVVIYAELMNYRGNTPETVNKSGYLFSLNGDTGSITPVETVTGTVAETIAAADNSGVVIPEATIMAKSKAGIVVADATGSVYLFFNSKNGETVPDVAVGDNVKVEATKSTYGGIPEFTKPTVTKLSGGTAVYPEPRDLNPVAASYESAVTEFVTLTGTLKISGNFVNIEINGVDPASRQGSVSQPLDSFGVNSFDGKQVTVTGYFTGITTSKDVKYINIVITDIALADPNAKYCNVTPATISAKADATSATFTISANAAWTVTSDNEAFVVSPASGDADATVTVTFSANEGDSPRVANLTVVCADANVETVVVLTQSKPSSGEKLTIEIDFNTEIAALPQSKDNGITDATVTLEGYEFKLHAEGKTDGKDNVCYQAKSGGKLCLLIGRQYAYLQLPAIEGKALAKIEFLTGAGASNSVVVDVAKADGSRLNVNNTAMPQGTTFAWEITGEEGMAYKLLVVSNHNAQFQNLTLTYE